MPGNELLVEHRNLAADRHDLADQDFQGGARIGWQGIVGKRLLGQLREVGDAGFATDPSSARCARKALASMVRWRTSRDRARWVMRMACCSTVLIGTNRIVGR